ncbi:MAG TPA: LysR family transcriptional regulator [Novosphingobium sp.]|nr:LysR family transcriptional regulator [Novosphingobium sp.]HZV08179.1 LysR family transcriptional regulator [Novosphingobium sp.]
MLHARLLTYIDEVVRQGSIRRAAEKLNVASSAISRQILALEEQIGAPLFDRSGRRLRPTAAGELLVRHVRETLKEMTRTQAMIEELKGLRRGSVSIGLMSGLAANILPRAVNDFHESNPRVEVRLKLMTTGDEILNAVEKGEVALGLGFDFPRHAGVRVVHAATGRLGAVMNPEHPLAGQSELRLRDCAPYPLVLADPTTAIRPHIDEAFARSGFTALAFTETNSIEMMRQMAILGRSITFLTPFDIEFEQRMGRLTYVPMPELARHEQRLMLVQNERRSDALAGLLAERLKALIHSVAETGG